MEKTLASDCVPLDWVKNFKGYKRPICNDTAVVTCYFSACRFNLPMQNAKTIMEDLRNASIPAFMIELCYLDQKSVMNKPTMVVKSDSYMFHKENILNILCKKLDNKYKKIIFLDADVRFDKPDWVDTASRSLDENDVIQPMEWSYWSLANNKVAIATQITMGRKPHLSYCHPGFAFGVRRDWLDRVGGLYEDAIIGTGDACFWSAVGGSINPDLAIDPNHMKAYTGRYKSLPEYNEKIKQNAPKVGYVRGCLAGHLPHGSWHNRRYAQRQNMLSDNIDVYKNEYGVFEWVDKSNNEKVFAYFKSRDEDNLYQN